MRDNGVVKTGGAQARLSVGRELALVSLLYLLMTAALTYPTVLGMGSHIPGYGDAARMPWDLWAFARAATDPQVPMSTTDLILFPLPDVQTLWEATPSLLLGVPLVFLLGPIASYSLVFLLSFVLSGSLTFLLARYLSVNRLASFVAGAIFAFSAYHYAHALGHMHLLSMQWLPLFVLALLLLWDRPSLHRALYLGLAMVLVVADSPYYTAYFLAPVLVCFFVYHLWRSRARLLERRFLAGLFLALVAAAGSALLVYPRQLSPDTGTTEALRRDAGDTERYSADMLAYLVPSLTHPVFGSLVAPVYASFTAPANTTEMTVYLGWVALFLAAWGIRARRGPCVPFWVLLALVGFVLSLGPVLHIGGQSVIPLPYALLMKLPLFWTLRAPSRICAVVLLAVAIMASYGLNDLLDRVKNRPTGKAIMGAAVVLLVCFDSLYCFPYPSSAVVVPAFYQSVVTGSVCESLFELPTGPGHDTSTYWYMLYQMYHGRRLAHGLLARQSYSELLFPYWVLRSRFLSPPMGGNSSDTWPAFEASFDDLLALNRITCVVAQRQAGPSATSYSEEEYGQLKASLTRSLGDPFYEDDGLVAYEIQPRTAETRASFSGELELIDHKLVRTTSCPDGSSSCTFLVTFWRADEHLPQSYHLRVQLVRHNGKGVLAATAHSLGYQFTLGKEVACYNASWWPPGVVIADYTLLPSTDTEGVPLSVLVDIKIRVTEPKTRVTLPAQSDYYTVDAQGRLLLESYRP
jgi:hypothetical protein